MCCIVCGKVGALLFIFERGKKAKRVYGEVGVRKKEEVKGHVG